MVEQANPSRQRLSRAVVVPCRDRAELLAGALEAIGPCLGPDDELVVVDSASRDAAVAEAAEAGGADVVRCEVPGVSRARNAGARAVASDVVVFVDDDCRPAPGWLDALVAPLEQDETLHFVTGAVHARGDGPALSVDERSEPERLEDGHPVGSLGHSANMAFRRTTLLDALGGFDAAMGSGAPLRAAEDADVQWRAMRRGYDGWFEPTAVVHHEAWRDRRAALRQSRAYGVGAAALALKISRNEAGSGRFAPAQEAWRHLWRDLGNGYRFGVLVSLARIAGVLRGAFLARRLVLHGDVFRLEK